jgi:hypothetical protein
MEGRGGCCGKDYKSGAGLAAGEEAGTDHSFGPLCCAVLQVSL